MKNLSINNHIKKNSFLVCIDSDGTAIDAMTIKHLRAFGPCLVKEWQLEKHSEDVLKLWNSINLYKKSRGVNRFLGLYQILSDINNKYLYIEDLSSLKNWTETTAELSNNSLIAEIEKTDSDVLKKALSWSLAVNAETAKLQPDDKKPFKFVEESLAKMHTKADIAIVSSAGLKPILEEWTHFDLIKFVDVLASQEDGTKSQCIAKFINMGYLPQNVIMMGDAVLDLQSANANGVYFYPIVPKEESICWQQFLEVYLDEFLNGNFSLHQEELTQKFMKKFEGE